MAVRIILKNTVVEDKRPTSGTGLLNGEITVNQHESGCFLCTEDTAGNIQQIGGVKVSEDAPGSPVRGTMWLQPSSSKLYVHNGTTWLQAASGSGGGGAAGVSQLIGGDGVDISPAGGTGVVTASVDSDENRGVEIVAGKIAAKLGTGLTFDGSGNIASTGGSALTYKGTVDLTAATAPPAAVGGDAYANTGSGTSNAAWNPDIPTGTAVDPGDLVVYTGSNWTLIPTGGGAGSTDLSVTNRTGTTLDIDSSTGADATVPASSSTEAGLMTATQFNKLDGIAAGAQVNVATDLSNTPAATTVEVESSTGTNTTLPAATAAAAGVMTGADKSKLDGIDAGAEVNVNPTQAYTAAADKGTLTLTPGSDTTDLPLVTTTEAGLMIPADKSKLDEVAATVACMPADLPAVADREPNMLWYNLDDGRTYIWVSDDGGTQYQFVDASPDNEAEEFWSRTGTTLTPNQNAGNDNVQTGGNIISAGNIQSGGDAPGAVQGAVLTPAQGLHLTNGGETHVISVRQNGNLSLKASVQASGNAVFQTLTAIDMRPASVHGAWISASRNLLDNGAMQVWTRGTVSSQFRVYNNSYASDRWRISITNDNCNRSEDVPPGFCFSQELSAASGSMSQGIELLGSNRNSQFPIGSTWTVSFYANASQSDVESLAPSASFRDAVAGFTIIEASDSYPDWEIVPGYGAGQMPGFWRRYKSTFTITGDADNSPGTATQLLQIDFPGAATFGYAYRITGCQLEPGTIATPYAHEHISVTKAKCARYCQTSYGIGQYPGVASGTGSKLGQILDATVLSRLFFDGTLPYEMRIKPAVVTWDNSGNMNSVGAYNNSGTYQRGVSTMYQTNKSLGSYLLLDSDAPGSDLPYSFQWLAVADL